jgi:hypothetical protein
MYRKNIMMFTLGAAIGSLFTYLYMNEKQQRMLEEEEELRDLLVKHKFGLSSMNLDGSGDYLPIETESERSNRLELIGKSVDERLNEEVEQEKKVLIMNRDRYKKIATNYSNSPEIPEPTSKPVRTLPYVISFEDFCESEDAHDKITITYYAGDGVLVDEDEEIIDDVERLVGENNLINKFGEGSDDPDVLYVRNERLAIDYEVIRQHTSYGEVVSGEHEET